ncbi:DNA polymerase III subunit beta [Paenibacillus lautus]|uniref:DNA polymerase III subunit beta n=1 Tax=Paenibacillus lautus TaxID=1401 RepID=UPI00203C7CBD|nr:DNA polymerase III subunit beta [Paenibacillus lautus]MCM3257015.1 DNA polymerase III subunit beta [Paenibacillus lautus]
MKIIVNTKEVQTAFKNLLKVAPKNPSLKILDSIKIEVVKENVFLTSTDVSLTVCVKLKDFEILEPGSAILPRETVKLISKLTDYQMCITEESIVSGKRKVNYESLDVSAYPRKPNHTYNREAFKLNNTNIKNLLDVTYACSTSEATPVLQGVLIRGNNVVSTDRHRMALNTIEVNNYPEDMVIPAYAINLIPTFTDKAYKDYFVFTVDKEGRYMQVLFDNIEMEVRLMEGTYPNIDRIIPQKFTTEIKLNKTEFIEELKIMKDVVTSKTKLVKLNIINGKVSLFGEAEKNSLVTELDTTITGKDIAINANLEYILDAVQKADSPEVVLKLTGAVSPFMVNNTALVLPYRTAS